jgi:hypothetical protein
MEIRRIDLLQHLLEALHLAFLELPVAYLPDGVTLDQVLVDFREECGDGHMQGAQVSHQVPGVQLVQTVAERRHGPPAPGPLAAQLNDTVDHLVVPRIHQGSIAMIGRFGLQRGCRRTVPRAVKPVANGAVHPVQVRPIGHVADERQ